MTTPIEMQRAFWELAAQNKANPNPDVAYNLALVLLGMFAEQQANPWNPWWNAAGGPRVAAVWNYRSFYDPSDEYARESYRYRKLSGTADVAVLMPSKTYSRKWGYWTPIERIHLGQDFTATDFLNAAQTLIKKHHSGPWARWTGEGL